MISFLSEPIIHYLITEVFVSQAITAYELYGLQNCNLHCNNKFHKKY